MTAGDRASNDTTTPALASNDSGSGAFASATQTDVAVEVEAPPPPPTLGDAPSEKLIGNNANDDLSLGKRYFRDGDYGVAEKHFRRAVELHPLSAEGWLGLAACYDRLRRFDFADRAYAQAIRLAGVTAEILNNQGYSYMLRGNYAKARLKLDAAARLSPGNPYVAANKALLAQAAAEKQPVE
ncbi:MAG: tetratricopeptide repeat protein [Pseudolabrys sp.]|nr:tetratricopeptide repeat protein [Pseudolabrys sp.]